jgi:hypothetical protein
VNAIVCGLSLGASLILGVVTVGYILAGLRRLYRRGGGGVRDIGIVAALSQLTGALILVQLAGVVSQIALP